MAGETASVASLKKAPGQKKKKPTHPPTAEMVNAAIRTLKERGGSSLSAIKKYLAANYEVDVEKLAPFIKKYLNSAVAAGKLIQTKGKGASGSFKLPAADKMEKVAAKPKKAAVKKSKNAVKPENAGEKKAMKPANAVTEKKSAAKPRKPAKAAAVPEMKATGRPKKVAAKSATVTGKKASVKPKKAAANSAKKSGNAKAKASKGKQPKAAPKSGWVWCHNRKEANEWAASHGYKVVK